MNRTPQDGKQSLAGRLVRGPAGFRQLLQRLGPTYIKLGQFLALRPDLIPQEYCDELMGLLDQVPPFPWNQARAILREDLGRDPYEVFALINPRPVAAGSLAQTHAARLKNGREVAIKIQRPNIEQRVIKDLRRARLLARLLGVSNVQLFASPREVVAELSVWLMQEIDFTHELANMLRLYDLTADSQIERVPRPYPKLSGKRVLTAEFFRGVPLSEVLVSLRSGLPDERERLDKLEVDWSRFAANLVEATLRQIFRYQFFHADLHPGNLLVLPGDTIGYVDFGLCDELDETVRRDQLRYLTAVYNRDVEQVFRALTELLIPGDATDVEAFRMDFMAETNTWLGRVSRAGTRGVPARSSKERSPIAQWLIGVMRAARRHDYQVPMRVLSMYRALLTAETVASELAPGVDLRSVGRDFFSRLALEDSLHTLRPQNWQSLALNLLSLWRDSPGQLRQILGDLAEGRFELNVQVTEGAKVNRSRNRRARLIATSIISVGIAILIRGSQLPDLLGVPSLWLLGVILGAIYLSIYIQWRRLR